MNVLRYSFVWIALILHTFVGAHVADLIIFSFDRPLQLWSLLESIEKNISNLGNVKVLYRASSQQYSEAYDEVKKTFNAIDYVQQSSDHPKKDFKPLLMQCLDGCDHEHILFAVDDIIVTRPIDLNECIEVLEETHAYAFYLRVGLNLTACYSEQKAQPIPPGMRHKDRFFVWNFKNGTCDWGYPNSVDMCIYRKHDVINRFAKFYFDTPNILESRWASMGLRDGTLARDGVCYETTMIVNIPLNCVQNDYGNPCMHYMTTSQLLSTFNAGEKIDIKPLQAIENKSAHMEYEPTFIKR